LISDIGLERRKANTEYYDGFERDGDLTKFVYREADNYTVAENILYVVEIVQTVLDRGLLAHVGVDAAGIGAIVDALAEIGVTQDDKQLGAVRQGVALMGAIKTIEIKLADRSFRHGGQPLLAWCVGNAKVIPTRTAMMIARDEAGFGKIDPLMALFNAAALMATNPEAMGRSFWNTDIEEEAA
jgi:phage terminase large subunit-like protein